LKKDRILIVDDDPLNIALLEAMLESLGYESRTALDGEEALNQLHDDIDLVLLDINMPGITGFYVACKIRSNEAYKDLPIIMVTALSSIQDRLAAVEAGANDFICKPVEEIELRVRVGAQLRAKHAQDELRKNQSELERKFSSRTSALEAASVKLARLNSTDPLTGLANHQALVSAMEDQLEVCRKASQACGVLFIDIDHFKAINEAWGHSFGDQVLSEIAQIIQSAVGDQGTEGRWGGEEFLAILPGMTEVPSMELAEQIRTAVATHQFEKNIHLTCSVGVAIYPRDGWDRGSIAEAADMAMYVAKKLGRNQVRAAADVREQQLAIGVEEVHREEMALGGMVRALTTLVAARDAYTGGHTRHVEEVANAIAATLGLESEMILLVRLVAKLHDVGKVAIADSILQKPGKLTDDEMAIMKQHSAIGAEIVSHVPSLRLVAPGVRSHHERWDGSGYPDALIGDAIPVPSRIVAVADAYSAMTTDRPYRPAQTEKFAIEELLRCSGTQFDPAVVEALLQILATANIEERRAA
jgi:two-component system cell cycle response regulator